MNTRVPETAFQAAAIDELDSALVQQAAARARVSQTSIVTVLAELIGLDERATVVCLAAWFNWQPIETQDMLRLVPDWDRMTLAEAMQRHVVLVRSPVTDAAWIGVITDPLDTDVQTWLRAKVSVPVELRLALRADLDAFLSKQEETMRAAHSISESAPEDTVIQLRETLSFASISAQSNPVVRAVSSNLYDALKAGASDVHLESTATGMQIKYRVDGVLEAAGAVAGVELAQQVISRLKVLAELDIAERRIPQDGSFRVHTEDRDIDLRLSIMPGVYGEDAVIRVLDKRGMLLPGGSLTLDALGMGEAERQVLRSLASQAYGMLLVTGPTGSGKTTTLYAALSERHSGREKIITIEDPVEYQLPGVLQIPVHEKKGLTFAKGLRSVLRHDPDIIMVGEIRDQETAEIAVQSALTGHLVFSTVHANSVFDVFSRFAHMGIDPYAFSSALNGVWAQRLMRINCPRCSTPVELDEARRSKLGLDTSDVHGAVFRAGVGCGDCRGTGYRGRRAISEVLVLDDEMRELIVRKAPVGDLKAMARQKGVRTLRTAALALLLTGQTTPDEVERMTLHV